MIESLRRKYYKNRNSIFSIQIPFGHRVILGET